MIRLEVRCCCDPSRLFGHLDVQNLLVKAGGRMRFVLWRPDSPQPCTELGDGPTKARYDHVELMVRTFYNEGKVYLALSSEETPLETLERIPGFRKAA